MHRRLSTVLCFLLALVVLAPATTAGADAPAARKARTPHRIVSLSPTATEMLFAIGAGKQVVAVDDQSDFPKSAPRTKLSGFEPNAEAVIGRHPDLVVLPDTSISDQLRELGTTPLVLDAAKTLDDTYSQIRQLGDQTGHRAAAARLVRTIRDAIRSIVRSIPKTKKAPSAYYELDNTFFSADSTSFIGRVLHLAGFSNIADAAPGDGSGYPQLSAEYVVQADPDVIFLADTQCCHQTPARVAKRPGFADLTAVRKHHIVSLSDDIASRWGPRVVDLLRTVAKERTKL